VSRLGDYDGRGYDPPYECQRCAELERELAAARALLREACEWHDQGQELQAMPELQVEVTREWLEAAQAAGGGDVR
jgi:hypothetical protein